MSAAPVQIQLAPVADRAWQVMAGLAVAMAAMCALAAWLSPAAWWPVTAMAGLGSVVVIGLVALSLRVNRATLAGGELRLVAGALFRKRVALAALDLNAVEVIHPPRHLGQLVGWRCSGLACRDTLRGGLSANKPEHAVHSFARLRHRRCFGCRSATRSCWLRWRIRSKP